jgi:hypothetical protein
MHQEVPDRKEDVTAMYPDHFICEHDVVDEQYAPRGSGTNKQDMVDYES